jgi:uncharacterized protein (TIGR02722 family)
MVFMYKLAAIAFVFFFAGCQTRTVTRISPDVTVDLSGRWNDSDSRAVAGHLVQQLLTSQKFKDYVTENEKKPSIIIGLISNKTSEHIDAATYVKKFEMAIYNSNVAELVESEEFRDKLRLERAQQQDFADPSTISKWGNEVGADLMLFGEMTSETDTYNNKRVVNYITTLYLTDIETNKRVWYGQHEIKKLVKN